MATTRARLRNEDVDENLARSIRTLMAARRLSQEDLASAVGIPRSSLNQRLSGVRQFRPAELVAIAEVLGVPVGVLFEDIVERLSEPVRQPASDLLTSTYRQLLALTCGNTQDVSTWALAA